MKCDARKSQNNYQNQVYRTQHLLNDYKKISVNDNMNIIQAVCDFILFTKRLT